MKTLPIHLLPATLLIATSVVFSGCDSDPIDSTNIQTKDIYADITIKASASGRSDVKVELNVDNARGGYIGLNSTEKLEASVGSTIVVLTEDTGFTAIEYQGSFDTSSSDDPFIITLSREDGSIIDGSSVSLPNEFLMTSPEEDEEFDSDQTAALEWSPIRDGETIELNIDTTCTLTAGGTSSDSETFELDDDGEEDFDLSDLSVSSNGDLNTEVDCSMEMTLTRQQDGVLDERLETTGKITATQSRKTEDMVLSLIP